MAAQLENSLRQAEEHLLHAEAEMAKAVLEITEAAEMSRDRRLSELAEVVSTHSHLVAHLATLTVSACAGEPSPEEDRPRLLRRAARILQP